MKRTAFLLACYLVGALASWANDPQEDTKADGPELVLWHPVASVRIAVFRADGKQVATASRDGRARIWDAESGELLHTLTGLAHGDESDDRLLSLKFSPDGSRLAGLSQDEHTYLWDPDEGQQVRAFCGRKWRHSVVQFRPDSQHLLLVEYGCAYIKEAGTGRGVRVLQGDADGEDDDADWVEYAAYSPDGRFIVTTIERGDVTIWDAKTLEKLRVLSPSRGHSSFARFSPDGRQLVTYHGLHARVWDTESGEELLELSVGRSEGTGRWIVVAFSPDGSHMLTSNRQKAARLWDARTGKLIAKLEGHTNVMRSAGFSPDGKHILTVSTDLTVGLWDARTGRMIAKLEGHTKVINTALFSPDGKHVLTASTDQSARLWDTANGALLRTLQHEGKVYSARFSPDGKRIVTASKDGAARIWSVAGR